MKLRRLFAFLSIISTIAILVLSTVPTNTIACDPEAGEGIFFSEPMAQMAAAKYKDKMYIFGGTNGTAIKNTIMIMDPSQQSLTTLDVNLPRPMNNAEAFTYEDKIFIFGGTEPGNMTRNENLTIFDPVALTIEVKSNFFSHGMEGNSIAQDGKYFYFFGNCMCPFTPGRKDALRFDAETYDLKQYPNVLPDQLAGSVATFYEGACYIFGGKNQTHDQQDTILKWIPGDTPAEVLETHLPYPMMKMGIATVEHEAFLLGGLTDRGMTDKVLLFDLKEETVKVTGQLLTHPKASRACVVIRDTAYLAGGDTPDGPGGGIEVIPLPVSDDPVEDDDGDSSSFSQGDIVLTLGIIGAVIIFLIVIAVYVQTYRKKEKDDDDTEEVEKQQRTNKLKK